MNSMIRVAAATFLHLVTVAIAGSPYLSPTFGSTKGGTLVYITADETIGCSDFCAPPQVLFGGLPSPSVTVVGPHQIHAITPAHSEEAIVPVTIITPTARITVDNAFAFAVDRDPVLVPLFFDSVAGFGGSRWSIELWVHNGTNADVSLSSTICNGLQGLFLCPPAEVVPANTARRLLPPPGWHGPFGTLYSVPSDVGDQITFDLRLEDLAHPSAGTTSIPVVRGLPARQKIVLLNIPTDAGSRKLLRVYGGQSFAANVHVYDLDSGVELATEQVIVQLPTDGLGFGATATSAIFDNPSVLKAARLRVEIVPLYLSPQPFWAMLSVTDNATQHVNIISPAP